MGSTPGEGTRWLLGSGPSGGVSSSTFPGIGEVRAGAGWQAGPSLCPGPRGVAGSALLGHLSRRLGKAVSPLPDVWAAQGGTFTLGWLPQPLVCVPIYRMGPPSPPRRALDSNTLSISLIPLPWGNWRGWRRALCRKHRTYTQIRIPNEVIVSLIFPLSANNPSDKYSLVFAMPDAAGGPGHMLPQGGRCPSV